MPDIIKDYDMFMKKMSCTSDKQSCYYIIDDQYEFKYNDGLAEIVPRNTLKQVPRYVQRPPKDPDGFIVDNFPYLKQRRKFVTAILIIIVLILLLVGIFFTYEVYFVYIVPLIQKIKLKASP